jgi:hypothetical protein
VGGCSFAFALSGPWFFLFFLSLSLDIDLDTLDKTLEKDERLERLEIELSLRLDRRSAIGYRDPIGGLCSLRKTQKRCYDVGIADFPATATLLAYIRPCRITSKVKQQAMGSMDQRVPWNQFSSEAKVGHSGSPICDCGGIRRWTCYKKCTSASALSPRLPLVRRESGCTGVYRSDSLDTLMQEERAHFRVDAIWRRKRGPFLSF